MAQKELLLNTQYKLPGESFGAINLAYSGKMTDNVSEYFFEKVMEFLTTKLLRQLILIFVRKNQMKIIVELNLDSQELCIKNIWVTSWRNRLRNFYHGNNSVLIDFYQYFCLFLGFSRF